jgi:hypothetical protein
MISALAVSFLVVTQAPAVDTPAVTEVPLSPNAADAPVDDGVITVAVLDLKTTPDSEGIGKAMTTLVTSEVAQHKGWKALSRNELKALLAHQSDARLLGCEEAQCLADIGKLAKADRVISGGVEKGEGDAIVFSLSLFDPSGPVVLDRIAWTWRAPADDLVDLARPAVDRLLNGKQADGFTGALEILAVDGADVTIDEKPLGQTPVKPVKDLAIGVHHVTITKSGYVTWSRSVAVSSGDTHLVQAELVDEMSLLPWYARWYVWAPVAAGAVVIGGAIAAVATYQYLQTPSTLVVGGPPKSAAASAGGAQ